MDQTKSLPPYLVTAISMADYMVNAVSSSPSVEVVPPLKILDFGNGMALFIIFLENSQRNPNITAFRKGDVRPPMQCAVGVRPPEVVFSTVALGNNDPDWDMRSDIWSLGCTVSLFNFYLSRPCLIWLCIDLRNRFRVYLVLWCGCGWFIGSDGEDNRKAPTCMGVVLGLKSIPTKARCELSCPLSLISQLTIEHSF